MKPRPEVNPAALVDPEVACCAGCVRLEDVGNPTVVLLSGIRVCTYCPAWLAETAARQFEALNVLDLSTREKRLAYLDERERLYGAEYRARLAAVVLETWDRRRGALAEPSEA
jgi:hypothetical protein